jgi:hypothetical protein
VPIAAENRHRYPPDWSSEIRPAILRRAELRCECEGECGRGHRGRCPERHLQPAVFGKRGYTVVLAVAHLNHAPEDDDPGVLRAMCQGCHLDYDRDHHRQSEVERWQRALEGAGQLSLVDTRALGGHAALPPRDRRQITAAEVERNMTTPARARQASLDVGPDASPPGADDASRGLYSLDTLPAEVRLGLLASIEGHNDAQAWLDQARRTLGVAIAEARAHGGQVNELAAAAGISRPRLYRLLEQPQMNSGPRSAGAPGARDTEEGALHA